MVEAVIDRDGAAFGVMKCLAKILNLLFMHLEMLHDHVMAQSITLDPVLPILDAMAEKIRPFKDRTSCDGDIHRNRGFDETDQVPQPVP